MAPRSPGRPVSRKLGTSNARLSLEPQTYKAAVFDKLADMICELDVLPGTRLVESDLAVAFHVSKTPIREAFLLLQAEGLVELAPFVGARVTWLTIEEYEELSFLLDALEKPSLPIACSRITDAELATAARLVGRLERARATHDASQFSALSLDLHQALFASIRSRRLTTIVTALVGRAGRRYARVFQHQFDDAWDIEFELISGRFEGIRARDPERAIAAVEAGHSALLELARARVTDPLVAPYLRPADDTIS